MENWQIILAPLEHGLDEAMRFLRSLPQGLLLAGLFVPVVVAAVARRWLATLAALAFVVVSFVILVEPALLATTLALASYVGSVFVAVFSVRSWWKHRAMRAELAGLREDVDQLLRSESHRMMVELRSNKHEVEVIAPGIAENPLAEQKQPVGLNP